MKEAPRINLAEPDAVLKGINLALQWGGGQKIAYADRLIMHVPLGVGHLHKQSQGAYLGC